ncbi:interferon-induced GTP-binding protein Mx [Metarhizium guizhouense ARSEF 977]|uniref:Interferon-induced GTP-binding protein Mx n=1 Tax=Metarhizium guizhouense (strain ARSEF 977) TaxID=1276136 RepID=A0A0B4G659_METGA|nr:interferon-induced GTP-binding protein Mx [Metarhizium guizhouense ARSEF 977]
MGSVTLQSQDHRDLLDIVDKLRSKGISRYVDLPEIIVCGDQSAGKSSVLEAISGMAFPTKDNLCTRFATELILHRSATPPAKASIIPGPGRLPEERESLCRFNVELDLTKPGMGMVVGKAKEAMGLSEVRAFSTDILRVELCGPSQPHLTWLIFLAFSELGTGINRSKTQQWSGRCIILAVVSAKSDFALQEITEMARELDPKGNRTLGLITKPDALDVGSDSEAAYVKLAENKDVAFRLGWHILKNRDYKMRDATSAERDEAEERFFESGIWATMNPRQLGVKSLKPRLSNVLKDQILLQLSSLLNDVETEISICKTQLQRLGSPRTTAGERRRYLLQVSREFSLLMKAAVNDEEDERRWICRSAYIDKVKELMKRSRGRELPGTFNPLVISELFAQQCQPWEGIARAVGQRVLQVVYEVARDIVEQVAAEDSVKEIFHTISTALEPLKCRLHRKFEELLKPHYDGHPITFNHYLTDTVQKMESERRRQELLREFKRLIGTKTFTGGNDVMISPLAFFNSLEKSTEVDMERYGSELAIDYTLAYHKLAMKKFIDDVGVLAVEQCLISQLPSLFLSESILDLSDDEVIRMANESDSASLERTRCAEKLAVLEDGKSDLKRLESHRTLSQTVGAVHEESDQYDATQSEAPSEDGKSETAETPEEVTAEEVPDVSTEDFTVTKKMKKKAKF